MEPLTRLRRAPPAAAPSQRGAVLIVALIVFALMSIAAASVVRSTDTANLLAGNIAFRQATMHASDIALERAWQELVTGAYPGRAHYYSTRQTASPDFSTPASIAAAAIWDGGTVPCIDARGMEVGCDGDAMRIQYVIERQCDAEPDLASADSIKANCDVEPSTAAAAAPDEIGVHYRVIVRARGARGTLGLYEALVGGPAV